MILIDDPGHDPDATKKFLDELEIEYAEFVLRFRDFTRKHFGPKCQDYYEPCPTCRMWKAFEAVEEILK